MTKQQTRKKKAKKETKRKCINCGSEDFEVKNFPDTLDAKSIPCTEITYKCTNCNDVTSEVVYGQKT